MSEKNSKSATKQRDDGPSVWPDSTHLTSILGFAATQSPKPASEAAVLPLFDPERVFDVCHVGLVLRAVLGVQGLLALGLALAARGPAQWAAWMASATVVSLSGVLLWLLLVCLARRVLARLAEPLQWALLSGLGAVCALAGWQLLNIASLDPSGWFRLLSVGLAGAALAALLLAWLKLRERAQRPAAALAQLVELQSRIRPHFLFNTLNSAIALVRYEPAKAEHLLEDLSELFRVALADASTSVSLAEEIELARRYLHIEQTRFGERLRIRWQLDPLAADARVPPLVLQPLVENAVRHGVEPNDAGGDIEVRTRRRGSEVEIRVSNSVDLPARSSGHGLALRNVRQRLRLMHDVSARFELNAEPGRFTVRIVLPF
ncbi:two-component system sensor histidine kinase AlgZ [Paucibacter oligotrophus]|uniref:Two-component system sensor histidine kinase AlgZ n=1 Tax=Roseateles oligotrophus TaxID=1769250 RepID=A0A840LAC8_9BURK|nr:histidine kinase [Roseateles oligotrophus]MBB4843725.1 two-component system sensor histidine kinase AlgZ [Roseateles oligotrophus]